MAVFTKRQFSGATGGKSIAIATGLTTIHSSVTSGATDFDEYFFYVHNLSSVSRIVTTYIGATAAKDKVTQTIPSRDGFYLMVPGLIMNGGKTLKALATSGATNLTAHGFVNRIDQ